MILRDAALRALGRGWERVALAGAPNEFLATGNLRAVEDEIVRWNNVFG
jgi:hypothetical protein